VSTTTISAPTISAPTISAPTISAPPSEYPRLAAEICDAGLLIKRPGRYLAKMTVSVAALAAGWAALFLVGNSWWALAVAALLSLLSTQVVFFAHDAGHGQIFKSRRANWAVGLIAANCLAGMSFGWWVPKHLAHHAHPNVVDRDPDIGPGTLALTFTADRARSRQGAGRVLARYQAWLFFPLLLLEGLGLHISGVDYLVRRRDRVAALEGVLIAVNVALYLTLVLLVLSPLRAFAFIAVQQGLFGLYLGCSFAPNHKGMPIYTDDSNLDIMDRQVSTARNVAGGRLTALALGGLNYQIEHHLFPNMPRANLRKAQGIIRRFCASHDITYNENSLFRSYRQALSFLNAVGAS
jgi:fatty acid desaturase